MKKEIDEVTCIKTLSHVSCVSFVASACYLDQCFSNKIAVDAFVSIKFAVATIMDKKLIVGTFMNKSLL